VPHRHDHSAELFYILDGAFDLLAGEDVVVARSGDLLVVPPGMAHAFAAHRGSAAEALVIATPGIERFDYFRHVVRRLRYCWGCRIASILTSSTAPPGGTLARWGKARTRAEL
jgi:uncharacterized cupin superfamily protein